MESTVIKPKKSAANPLSLLPDQPVLEIARNEKVSGTAVENTIARLKITMRVTPTGRKTVSPMDAVRIVEDLRSRLARA